MKKKSDKLVLSTVEESGVIFPYSPKMSEEEQRKSTLLKKEKPSIMRTAKRTTTLIARNVKANPDLTWLLIALIILSFIVFLFTKMVYGVSAKELSDYLIEIIKGAVAFATFVFCLYKKLKTPPGPITKLLVEKTQEEIEREKAKEKDEFQRSII